MLLPPPLKAIVVNGKKKVAVNGVVNLDVKGGGGSSVQPDWEQNDSSKPDFIKNRICYESTDILFNNDITLHDTYSAYGKYYTASIDLSLQYFAVIDGVEYPLTSSGISDTRAAIVSFDYLGEDGGIIELIKGNMLITSYVNSSTFDFTFKNSNGDVLFSESLEGWYIGSMSTFRTEYSLVTGDTYNVKIGEDSYTLIAEETDGSVMLQYTNPDSGDMLQIFTFLSSTELAMMTNIETTHLILEHSALKTIEKKYIPDSLQYVECLETPPIPIKGDTFIYGYLHQEQLSSLGEPVYAIIVDFSDITISSCKKCSGIVSVENAMSPMKFVETNGEPVYNYYSNVSELETDKMYYMDCTIYVPSDGVTSLCCFFTEIGTNY